MDPVAPAPRRPHRARCPCTCVPTGGTSCDKGGRGGHPSGGQTALSGGCRGEARSRCLGLSVTLGALPRPPRGPHPNTRLLEACGVWGAPEHEEEGIGSSFPLGGLHGTPQPQPPGGRAGSSCLRCTLGGAPGLTRAHSTRPAQGPTQGRSLGLGMGCAGVNAPSSACTGSPPGERAPREPSCLPPLPANEAAG